MNQTQPASQDTFTRDLLAKGGETGALAASLDWASHPLGPPAGWPQPLKTTLGMLFHSSHPMFLWWGPELFQFYNDACLPSFGDGKHPRAMGQRGRDCWPEIWPIIGPQIDAVMTQGKASWNENQLVPILRNGQLEDVYWTYGYSPVYSETNEVAGALVLCTETTREVLARRRVEGLLAEAKATDQRKDEFLAMLAHELRNPLASVSLALSMLRRPELDAVKIEKFRGTAERQTKTLVRLVDELLDVSRITRGAIVLREQPVDLGAIVTSAVNASRDLVERDQRKLSVQIGSGPFARSGDPTRLEQMVANLLTNAAKYTPDGGAIDVQLTRDDSLPAAPLAVLRVRDDGRGIPREMLGQIFEIFVQVDPGLARSLGGLGLGLTLVRRIVELHGGTVEALSEGADRGSELIVRLPISALPPPATLTEPAPDRLRVLLVEDSDDVREPMAQLLELLGNDVSVATDGPSAVEKLLELKPDLALIDVGLPGLDGYEVAKRARAAGMSQIVLVALTGYSGADVKAKAQAAGFDLQLTKPLKTDDLSKVLDRARARNG